MPSVCVLQRVLPVTGTDGAGVCNYPDEGRTENMVRMEASDERVQGVVQMAGSDSALVIRRGQMRDCKDLLTVYLGTHWQDGFTTVEQVRAVHRVPGLPRWGWLVAEHEGTVIGEVLFHVEQNPVSGKTGVIDDVGVDVRYQKRYGIGTALVRAAEGALRQRRAPRAFALSPPEAYNFWMKVKYFARGSLVRLGAAPKDVPRKRTKRVETREVGEVRTLPRAFQFNHLSPPGVLMTTARSVLGNVIPGRLFEFYSGDRLIGVGAVCLEGPETARFVADVTPAGEEFVDVVIARTAKAASAMRARHVFTVVPKAVQDFFVNLSSWKVEPAVEIPVTRLL